MQFLAEAERVELQFVDVALATSELTTDAGIQSSGSGARLTQGHSASAGDSRSACRGNPRHDRR